MERPSFQHIAAVFLRYGNWTFGGGSATVAVLQAEIVERRGWVVYDEFALVFGLARLTPGTNLLSLATGVGWVISGWSGAATALLAGSIPCSLVALVATALYQTWSTNAMVKIALVGASAAAVGVMIATGWALIRPFWRSTSMVRIVLFVGGAVALGLGKVSPIRVLLVAACVGFLWPEAEAA